MSGSPGPPTESPLFEFDHVRVERGGQVVLADVELAVPDRGITVVVGPTGAGKSSIARLCNRLLDPTAGVVRFRGRPLEELDVLDLRRRVGLVLQRPTLFPGSVADNLAVATGEPVGPDEVRVALDAVGLPHELAERSDVQTLSGGQAQLACVARTMATEPEVLVADEPTASVDPAATTQLEAWVRRVADRGMPVLWITHDLQQMERLADHLVVVADGTVRAAGPAARVLTDPPDDVAEFLAHGRQQNQMDQEHKEYPES